MEGVVILRPCRRCRIREGCERKTEMLRRLRGSGVTAATFTCPERLMGLEPGRRVQAHIKGLVPVFSYDGPDFRDGVALGTVVCKSKKDPWRVVVRLDEPIEESNRQYVKLYPDTLTPLDEVRAICNEPFDPFGCMDPVGADGRCPKLAEHVDAAHDYALTGFDSFGREWEEAPF